MRFKEVAMILITIASGNAGVAVLKEVLKTNRPVKAIYRSPEDTAKASVGENRLDVPKRFSYG
jgi:hypothetical protein